MICPEQPGIHSLCHGNCLFPDAQMWTCCSRERQAGASVEDRTRGRLPLACLLPGKPPVRDDLLRCNESLPQPHLPISRCNHSSGLPLPITP